jgi:hypothetical protein
MLKRRFSVSHVLIFLICLASQVSASTVNASSCSQTDVQSAIDAAASGDTVRIPAGTCTWTNIVNVGTITSWNPITYKTKSLKIMGDGSQSVLGGGDATVIIDNLDRTVLGDNAALNVLLNQDDSFRLTGITFKGSGNSNSLTWHGPLRINGESKRVRVDHVHIALMNAVAATLDGPTGVIDHCLIDMVPGTMNNGIRIYHSSWNGGDSGDSSWADSSLFGTDNFMYIEDNTFNYGVADDCTLGGRVVFRNNIFNNTGLQTHPTGGGGRGRGCRAWEIYNNMFIASDSNIQFNVYFLSSGTGLIWGNSAPAGYTNFVTLHSMRKNSNTYSESATPQGWGYCGTEFNGLGSAWDQNTDPVTGYACLDQPGHGKGDLLKGEFPDTVNTRTGTIAWPNQALEPIYEWQNIWNPVPGYPTSSTFSVYETSVMKENRDYYAYTAAFNGATGVGSGPLSSRPSACTPTVAFWATDKNTLYQCGSANTWTAIYTPFTYPYPLDADGLPGTSGCGDGTCGSGESCSSCPRDCQRTPADDSPCNNCIELQELNSYINDWLTGQVLIAPLMDVIRTWKAGCG